MGLVGAYIRRKRIEGRLLFAGAMGHGKKQEQATDQQLGALGIEVEYVRNAG